MLYFKDSEVVDQARPWGQLTFLPKPCSQFLGDWLSCDLAYRLKEPGVSLP
jgi:hypothetical protein